MRWFLRAALSAYVLAINECASFRISGGGKYKTFWGNNDGGDNSTPDLSETTRNLDTLEHKAKLTDYLGKWLVIFFYPMDFTFVCPTEIRGFNSRYH